MNPIIITPELLNKTVPKEMRPKRLDSATCLLLNVQHNDQQGVLVFNTSPNAWKTWFPFYDDTKKYVIDYDFKSDTYDGLIKEHLKVFEANAPDELIRLNNTLNRLAELYGTHATAVSLQSLQPYYKLQFSKTADMWTLYRIEYFVATSVDGLEKIFSDTSMQKTIMPLSHNPDAPLNGLPITDSLSHLLNEQKAVDDLKEILLS